MVYTRLVEGPSAVGRNLKRLRDEAGMSLTDLAIKSKVSRSYISHIERGRIRNPRLEMSVKLATGLGVTLTRLLEEDLSETQQALRDAPRTYPLEGDVIDVVLKYLLRLSIYDVPGTLEKWAALPERKQQAVADMIRFLWSEEASTSIEKKRRVK